MHDDIEYILYSKEEIEDCLKRIGSKIEKDYKGKNPIFICILRGGTIFLTDLIRVVDFSVEIDFLSVSSYGKSTESSGIVKIRKDIDSDILNRHVIVVEDIIDTGLTLQYIIDYLQKHQPASVKICALLDKPEAHKAEVKIDYLGFEIENRFVVGYGLDFAEKYRNLPYIGVLKKEIYS
jgi:hypoxanthine phosphoribosyltransferase